MQAVVGDRLHIHGHNVGDPDKMGEIVEVRGKSGEPPYLVRFDDGHTGLVFPGPDAVVEHPQARASAARTASARKGRSAGKGTSPGTPASTGARSRTSRSPRKRGAR